MVASYGLLLFFDGGPGALPDFQLMMAPLLFGVLLNALLFGVFIVLVHSYFRLYYKTDHPWTRYLIYYLILMETINTVCDIGIIYQPLITLHASAVPQLPAYVAADPIVTALISTPTQLFMAWRILLVTKSSKWPAGVVAFLALASLAGAIAATALFAPAQQLGPHLPPIETALAVWLTSTAFADLFVTAFLVNFLWVNKTGFQTQTDSVTDKIIFFTVQTGALTSFAAIADVTLFLIVPNTTLNFIWDFSLSKMYSICLISTLNARTEWNALLAMKPSADEKASRDAIIRVRRATDIEGLQLYIPSQFSFGETAATSPRKRTPRPPPRATTKSAGYLNTEIAQRTAEWARATGR
ncbi:hypothetical protein DFH07DRAFT_936013 [Mycena maculata]|uniref:DUF6534 domain-containing protein n=1 Tax=Mycena maculata TaxID=230809 RepID=A0AAD7NY80_9AGAR|nr:hypothetical protein DFH07DRAFT_936013 [Mycena maculata]